MASSRFQDINSLYINCFSACLYPPQSFFSTPPALTAQQQHPPNVPREKSYSFYDSIQEEEEDNDEGDECLQERHRQQLEMSEVVHGCRPLESVMEFSLNEQLRKGNLLHHQQQEQQEKVMFVKGKWKPCEDLKLKNLVAIYGPQNWKLIAEKLEGRSDKSCRLRWFNQLDPKINKRAFTEEEDEKLMEAYRTYGSQWAMIARMEFPGRTDNALKNHWHNITSRRKKHCSAGGGGGYMKKKFRNNNKNMNFSNLANQQQQQQQYTCHFYDQYYGPPANTTLHQQQFGKMGWR